MKPTTPPFSDPAALYTRALDILDSRRLLNRPSAWAEHDQQIDFPVGSPIPGPLSLDLFPAMRGVMDAMGVLDPCTQVTMMFSAQCGKTLCYLLAVGERIDEHPTTIQITLPRGEGVSDFNSRKLRPLIRASARLRAKLGQRGYTSNVGQHGYRGGELILAGSAGDDTMRTDSVEIMILDDFEIFQKNKEGDHIELATGRTAMYRMASPKVVCVSSPGLVDGPTDSVWQTSSQETWNTPCLKKSCGKYQSFELTELEWTPGLWGTAHFLCKHCGEKIHQGQVKAMNRRGRWVARHPERVPFHRGFHASQANLPLELANWSDFAKKWEEAEKAYEDKRDETKRMAVINTRAGLPYESLENARLEGEAEKAFARREQPWNVQELPIQMLTVGCDPGGKGLDTMVAGHGFRDEKWVLDYKHHKGALEDFALWDAWSDFVIASDAKAVCIDGGYQLVNVCKQMTRLAMKFGAAQIYVWVTIGRHGERPFWPGPVDFGNYASGVVGDGALMRPVILGVDHGKSHVYGGLAKAAEPGADRSGPGYLHISIARKRGWFKQLYGERRVTPLDKAGKNTKWIKRHKTQRVEVLDTLILCMAGVDALIALRPGLREALEGPRPSAPVAPLARRKPRVEPVTTSPYYVQGREDSPF